MLDVLDEDEALNGAGVEGQVTREMQCKLTEAEIRERGEQMSAAEREIDRLKTKRKNLNAQIRGLSDRMTELSIAIDQGEETREVVCSWVPNYPRKVFDLTRSDNGAVIEQRAMGPADLQQRLPLNSKPKVNAAQAAGVSVVVEGVPYEQVTSIDYSKRAANTNGYADALPAAEVVPTDPVSITIPARGKRAAAKRKR